MSENPGKSRRLVTEVRGGYSSSAKLVSALKPPPRGAAPGARAERSSKPARASD